MSYNKTKLFQSFIVVPLLLTSISMTTLSDSVQKYVEAQNGDVKITVSAEEAALKVEREQKAAKIDTYFANNKMPLEGYGMKMVLEAEEHGIDWRLIPAISIRESTGGIHACKSVPYSAFGWGSCQISFKSYDHAIEMLALNLGGDNPNTAKYYEGKTTREILLKYNPPHIVAKYADQVISIMGKIEATKI